MGSPLPAAHHTGWLAGGGSAETADFFSARAERNQVEPGPGPTYTADESESVGSAVTSGGLRVIIESGHTLEIGQALARALRELYMALRALSKRKVDRW